ncbi:MAG: bifunctional diaminohydroxyphosphoribosylaminopyrimidine deaminase/5-amino-6-(5-phosphoribosylamino)uracil reductase RibD [Desulfobulbaceae bacterium]|nr:bifunctional diaminohydroxyphosphoribosylaminopyrimidine deaminase/5-amino-6-(5-phosphoribosylamino)uracil reductase RibD [Desulfobulbaceae bacterium]
MPLNIDQQYMEEALLEAEKGVGRTSPNPAVGAVVVKDGKIVGRGYHHKAGEPHAEVNAIEDAGECTVGATIFVTLEPCNHTGRTPPCTKAILEAGIQRVVIGSPDPNPGVKGGGAKFLASCGLAVTTGVLEQQCTAIIHPFLKHSSTGMPWVVMKAGMSLDGKISYQSGQGGKITSSRSAEKVHLLRDKLDAILIGVGTAEIDNPSLTVRLENGLGRDPLRIVLDPDLRLSPSAKMLSLTSSAETWLFCKQNSNSERYAALKERGAIIHEVSNGMDGRLDLSEVLKILGKNNIASVLVEGGAKIHGSMLRSGLVDEVNLFIAPFFIGDKGVSLLDGISFVNREQALKLRDVETTMIGEDILLKGYLNSVVSTGSVR